jgi:hypothetical protein
MSQLAVLSNEKKTGAGKRAGGEHEINSRAGTDPFPDHFAVVQQTLGNRAALRLLRSGAVQAKLTVSRPDDVYEQEADRMADEVLRMPEPVVQTKPLSIFPLLRKQPIEEEKELKRTAVEEKEEVLHAKNETAEPPEVSDNVERAIHALPGGGRLPETVRSFMEPRFGSDFSGVRVHSDAGAAELARSVNAQAFTVGRDIVFGAGRYSPETEPGKRLLAHELTHVVQQGGRQIQPYRAPQIQRNPTVVGVALAGLGIIQDRISYSTGGLQYNSDQISYPNDLRRVGRREPIARTIAEFRSIGLFSDNKTVFKLHGDFSDSYEDANETNRVMANVYIDLDDSSSYDYSFLSFRAVALQTPYGTPEDPRIRFVCSGRFNPAGVGDCNYRVVLEIDQHGDANCIEKKITSGSGKINGYRTSGFVLWV